MNPNYYVFETLSRNAPPSYEAGYAVENDCNPKSYPRGCNVIVERSTYR